LLIIIATIIIMYSIIILLGYYNLFPMDLDDYNIVAKNILYIGFFILFLGIFNFYRDLDIFAIFMSIIIIVLFITKIHQNINK